MTLLGTMPPYPGATGAGATGTGLGQQVVKALSIQDPSSDPGLPRKSSETVKPIGVINHLILKVAKTLMRIYGWLVISLKNLLMLDHPYLLRSS